MTTTGGEPVRTRGLEWILRLGVAACFVGHGAFGLLRKEAWLAYFGAMGIEPSVGWTLMPIVGAVDVAIGLSVLLRPTRSALVWAAGWALFTALLRPLAGEPIWETLERAGNYGVPLALLLLVLARDRVGIGRVAVTLQATTVLLLVGHGMLAIAGKPLLVDHAATLGLAAPAAVMAGASELTLAALVAFRPSVLLLLGVTAWKVATELLFPLSGDPVWEFIERGGSYAAPVALALLVARGAAAATPLWRRFAAVRRLAAAGAFLVALLPAPAIAQSRAPADTWSAAVREVPGAAELTRLGTELRQGGLVLFCRHAETHSGVSDTGPAREQQRNLNEGGRAQATRMGRAIRDAGIVLSDVQASPMFRTMDSAELAFGHARAAPILRGMEGTDEALRLLEQAPAEGNRVLMSHQGVIRRLVPIGRAPLREGDCLVIRPGGIGSGFTVAARVGADDWAAVRP